MEIKTITCHDVYNYGASLQAYALQTYLIQQGHQVEIIDYKPLYLNRTYNFWYISEKSRVYQIVKKNFIIHLLYSIWNIPRTYATWRRIYPFKRFKRNLLNCTKTYYSLNELKKNPPKAAIYIAGSDQIWNSELPNGKDPAFYLNFGESQIKRISYAASFGISNLSQPVQENTRLYLKALNHISVREKTGVDILRKLGFESEEVLDPVFLINSKEWLKIIYNKRIIKENYLLVYDIFQDDNTLTNTAKIIAQQRNLKIVSINDCKKLSYADINISNGGPLEFLNLIYYSDFVISCSFHATAFSVILNKPFGVFYNKGNISRLSDFLEKINLSYCLNPHCTDYSINWEEVNKSINEKILQSKNFIQKAIS